MHTVHMKCRVYFTGQKRFIAVAYVLGEEDETMLLRTPHQVPQSLPLVIEPTGQRCRRAGQCLWLGGVVNESTELTPEIKRRTRLARACFNRFKQNMYDVMTAPLTVKVRTLKAGVMETRRTGV